jgi:hypothetical protein
MFSLPLLATENAMTKCPYCARPLRAGGGLHCRACRRWILRWPHILILSLLGIAVAAALLELFFRLSG